MFSIHCQKNPISNFWYCEDVFSESLEVVEKPLMQQATELIDSVLMESYGYLPKIISILFDHNELFEPDVILKYKEQSNDGYLYESTQVMKRETNYTYKVWLCPYITSLYRQPPEVLHILITEIPEDA